MSDLVAELLNRDEDFRRVAHGDFLPSIHKRAADRIQELEALLAAAKAELADGSFYKESTIDALEAQIAAGEKLADDLAAALEECRPKSHAAMCPHPEYPWARCMCGCAQPALAAYRAAREARI